MYVVIVSLKKALYRWSLNQEGFLKVVLQFYWLITVAFKLKVTVDNGNWYSVDHLRKFAGKYSYAFKNL